MFGNQQKRKYSALVNSEEKEEEEQVENELESGGYTMGDDTSNNTTEATHEDFVDESRQQEHSTQNMYNQSSSNSIAHLTDLIDSLADNDQLDSSTQPKRPRFLPHSSAIFDDYNNIEFPFLVIPPHIPSVPSPSSSSSTDIYHSSRSVGLTDSTNSLSSDPDLPETDNGSDDNLSAERLSSEEVHEVIDLSSPVLPRGSSDVVDLTLEPNSPTRSNFVDLTGEAVEQIDSSPVIVSVNKIYERRSVIQPRPSCRFQVTPPCSTNQNNCITDITEENNEDGAISIENVNKEPGINNSVNGSTSCGESKKNDEKDQFHKSITCPICLDDAHLIKRKRQLSSTTCGHVFCDKCIKNAVKTQNRCPTCRKKLTLRQIHPLFL